MRRFLGWFALVFVGHVGNSVPVVAQVYQARPSAPAAPPTVNYFSLKPEPAQPAGKVYWGIAPTVHAAPRQAPPNHQQAPHHAAPQQSAPQQAPPHQHVHQHASSVIPTHQHNTSFYTSGSNGSFYWGTVYPFVWSGAYTPAFPVYYPTYLYAPLSSGAVVQPTLPARALDEIRNRPAPEPEVKPRVRASNAESKAKAGKFIGYGDANFGKQKYLPAVERYKTAAQLAPDLADPYLRQAFALVALGQYSGAVKAFRRALKIRSDWTDSLFHLDQLYGDDPLAKTSHIEILAKAVEANPLDSDRLTALGMQLFFDGQRDRSRVFFARAAQLGGNDDKLLNDFLPKPGPAAAKDQEGGKIVF